MKNTASALILALFCAGCSKDDASVYIPVNEEEVITTVTMTLTHGAQTITLTSRDLDGDGPDAPVVTVSGTLTSNTSYEGRVYFLNELASPISDITEEVAEEGHEHQIFYQTPLGVFTYDDADANGQPVGLQFTLTTGNAGAGNLIVSLVHEPDKSAAGVSAGDMTHAGGAVDAQVIYPIVVTD